MTRLVQQCYDEWVKNITALIIGIIVLVIITRITVTPWVFASSQQAYQDYLYQYDIYRRTYSDFTIAKNQYQKFNSLSSQSDALDKTKTMLTQRDQLLRSYLLLLNERLTEDQGLSASTKQTYQALLQNEASFLTTHAQLIPAVGSIDDAKQVSQQLESHYIILQVTIRQILVGLALGQLSLLSNFYENDLKDAQTMITTYAGVFTPAKQQTINRWILQIQNKQTFFQQKYDSLMQDNAQLTAQDQQELDQKYNKMSQGIAEARQYLVEGASFLIELKNALKYTN